MTFAVVVSLLVLAVVLAPFLFGAGGTLAAASSVDSAGELRAMKMGILQQYLADEAASTRGEISGKVWARRRVFLLRRYLDVARRLDYVEFLAQEKNA